MVVHNARVFITAIVLSWDFGREHGLSRPVSACHGT